MLARANRLTSGEDYRRVVKSGRRAGSRTLVVHVRDDHEPGKDPGPARVGFIVSKAVGGAVERNRVRRRLRHLCRTRVGALPAGLLLVVRALPESAAATSAQLDADLGRCLDRLAGVPA